MMEIGDQKSEINEEMAYSEWPRDKSLAQGARSRERARNTPEEIHGRGLVSVCVSHFERFALIQHP